MAKKVINIEHFEFDKENGLPIKGILDRVYSMEENIPPNPANRVSLDTVKQLLEENDYINAHAPEGDVPTANGMKNGFNSKKLYGKDYIVCNSKAQKIVLKLLQDYIITYNLKVLTFYRGTEDTISIDTTQISSDVFFPDVKNHIKSYASDISHDYISKIVNGFLCSKDYMYEVDGKTKDKYTFLPTAKGSDELGIRMATFTSEDTALVLNYVVYSPEAQKYIYDNFSEMLKYHNSKCEAELAA